MPRKPRCEVEAGIFHVYARGNERRAIFVDDVDRRRYLRQLEQVVERHDWRLLTYCLMPNHVHLLLETRRPTLGIGMRSLHGGYAQRFNARHDRCGHLFQGRYGSVRVRDDAQLWFAAAYVATNPVTAGLCDTPEAWPWSAHAAIAEGAAPGWLDVERLMWFFGALGGTPRERYVELVADRLAVEAPTSRRASAGRRRRP